MRWDFLKEIKNKPYLGLVLCITLIITLGSVYSYRNSGHVEAQGSCINLEQLALLPRKSVYNRRSPNDITLTDLPNSVCFLDWVNMEEIDGDDDEWGRCEVYYDDRAQEWKLIATQDHLGDVDIKCASTCLTW